MPSLTKVFRHMRRSGLIAKRECYCDGRARVNVLEEAGEWAQQGREVRGFVHIGEGDGGTSGDATLVPMVFGVLDGKDLERNRPDCLAVGQVVAECLDQEGIRYVWDGIAGSFILVEDDGFLAGVPAARGHHASPDRGSATIRPTEGYPDSAFEQVKGNPVRLLNVAKARQLGMKNASLRGQLRQPRVGDRVKLGFLVFGTLEPRAVQDFGDDVKRVQLESMSVEVTSVEGEGSQRVYRGELFNAPMWIDPAKLRRGSPVSFTAEHVYPKRLASGA